MQERVTITNVLNSFMALHKGIFQNYIDLDLSHYTYSCSFKTPIKLTSSSVLAGERGGGAPVPSETIFKGRQPIRNKIT